MIWRKEPLQARTQGKTTMITIVVLKNKAGEHFAVRRHNSFNTNPEGIAFLLKQKEGELDKAFERRVMQEANRRKIFYIKGLSRFDP